MSPTLRKAKNARRYIDWKSIRAHGDMQTWWTDAQSFSINCKEIGLLASGTVSKFLIPRNELLTNKALLGSGKLWQRWI